MGEVELQQIITGCLNQGRKEQKLLYKAFYGYAMNICLRYAGNRYEAAEIMNQGFFKIFKNLDKYQADKPFKAWVGRIMMNTSIDYYRSNLKMAYTDDLDQAEEIADQDLADKKLNYNDLLNMIQQLPHAYRTVFNLYAIEGYTHEEIGNLLGISAGTSKSNLFKARDKLRLMVKLSNTLPNRTSGNDYTNIVAVSAVNLNSIFFNNGILK
jgi:RNA polymerase sigma factor (sigma-70 family)